jgi:vacuolar-type H+-ATPase subunit C/Vma6
MRWEDLDARARGLATHLLTRPALDALAEAPDLAALAEALRRRDFPVEEGPATAAALELALRRAAAARLRILARWSGPRTTALTVLFEDEDRRSLRALLRGAVQGAPAEARLAGLIPTPTLPERALHELAKRDKPAAIAALLTAWRNPYGSALLPLASAAPPDLFRLEVVVNRTFAARASRAARNTGLLAAYVRETIDVENAYTALVLAVEGKDVTPKDVFLPGGEHVSVVAFETAAAGDVPEAMRRLAASFAGTPLAQAFEPQAGDPARLEEAVLRIRVRALVRAMRTEPLGPAPLLAYALRLRAELVDLRRIIWGVALAAPRTALAEDLVTV